MEQIVSNVFSNGLRKIFKHEWNSRYEAKFGAWDDTNASGQHLFDMEKTRKRPNWNVYQLAFQQGDTARWDTSTLYDAILYSNSIGKSCLNSTTKDEVNILREIRNSVKHIIVGRLSDADFKHLTRRVEQAFKAMGLPITDIVEIKVMRNRSGCFEYLPPKPGHEMVERTETISEISQSLQKLRTDNDGKLTYLYISGRPGSGKSQVSRQLCDDLFKGDNWETKAAFVITLDATNLDTLLGSYQDFCRRLNCCYTTLVNIINSYKAKEEKIKMLRSLITTRINYWQMWWIIADNVENLEIISPLLPQMGDKDWNNGQIILNTQNTSSVPCDSRSTKHVSLDDGMNAQECRQLLSLWSRTDVNDPILEDVSQKLDRQPLAMAAAALYLNKVDKKETKFSWQDYIQKLEEQKRILMEDHLRQNIQVCPSIMSAAVLLAEISAENNSILNNIFNLFSLISFHPLPLDSIVKYIQQLNRNCDWEDIYLAIKCCPLFLIENEDDDVSLHRIVHEAIKSYCNCERSEMINYPPFEIANQRSKFDVGSKIDGVVKALYCFKDRNDKVKMIAHLKALTAAIKQLFPEQDTLYSVSSSFEKHEYFEIYMFFGQILRRYFEYKLAIEFQNSNAQILGGARDSYIISVYSQLGGLHHDLGELEKAESYHNQALEIQVELFGRNHVYLATSYDNLGVVYRDKGALDQAKDCYLRALEIREKQLGSNHVDVATSYKAALFFAAKNDCLGVVNELHSKGFDLNVADNEGNTAVFYAKLHPSMYVLCELIRCGAQFNLDEIDGKAALFFAAKNNCFGVVNKLHSKDLDLNVADNEGNTAVFYANLHRSMYVLCELIRCGAQFNLDEIDGKAALFFAAENDCLGVVNKLYLKGVDVNVVDEKGKTAVFYANLHRIMPTLCDLIRFGATFNLDGIDGEAALFFAARNNRVGVVDELHSKGLDINVADDDGKTAVFYANLHRSMDVLCDLIRCDAQFQLDEIDGKAVWFFAAENCRKGVVKPFYNAGFDVNMTNDEGKTVVFYWDENFLDALLETDVAINPRDFYGRTPLFYALQENDTTRARYLIKNGANLQLKDNCNVNIFSFFVVNCISKNVESLKLFASELFYEEQQLKSLTLGILDIVHCQAPLLSVSGSPHLPKSYTICNKVNFVEVLAFAREQCLIQDADKVDNIEKVVCMIGDNENDVPLLLSFLDKLGVNPNSADSDGNTAVHYATILPLLGVNEETVKGIYKNLRKRGASFDLKNHQRESPLLFCLSPNTWKAVTEHNIWQSSISGLSEVCRFLLSSGCSINNGLENGDSIFLRIISLVQHGLKLNSETSRKAVLQVLIQVLKLLPTKNETVRYAVNNFDNQLNSPLHIWASTAHLYYIRNVYGEQTFESIMKEILGRLLKCGAKLNVRNANEQTPLHVCKTWTAVKLLIDAGANSNVLDASGNSPLIVAAKARYSPRVFFASCFYPDFTEDPNTFWRSALEKGLDPCVANKQEECLLGVLIKSENYALASALVEVLCRENYDTSEVKLSFLNAICKNKSKHIDWKINLVEDILKSVRTNYHFRERWLASPLRFCCNNIVQFGLCGQNPDFIPQNPKDEPSDDDEQPLAKKVKKGSIAKEKMENGNSNEEEINYDSVHCRIAKLLLSYGVDIDFRDSSGISCLDIAKNCSSLQDLLKKPPEIGTLPIFIPWYPVSDKYKGRLSKVARHQECEMVDQILYHRDHIGSGSFSHIFAGINEKDGREVAVKRVEKLRMQLPEDRREIENLKALAGCEQIVRYISFTEFGDFCYIVLELMEGNLKQYLDEAIIDATQATLFCKDVVLGLEFLHKQKMLHRDLKPTNVLYTVYPKLCLKIADFGLSRMEDSVSPTVFGTHAGTRCWIAPEVMTSKTNSVDKSRFQAASDMFTCGMLLHYIFCGQKHPFSPTDCSHKSELQVSNETEANIMKGSMQGWDGLLCPEATHLVKWMLESKVQDRPTAKEALGHPLFWSNEKKVDFLKTVGDQVEIECPRSIRKKPFTQVEEDLDRSFDTIVKNKTWDSSYPYMSRIHREMKNEGGRSYNTKSIVELVRFIRNVYAHYRKNTGLMERGIEQQLFVNFLFLNNFPNLVIEVYKAVTTHGWDKNKEDVKSAIKKK